MVRPSIQIRAKSPDLRDPAEIKRRQELANELAEFGVPASHIAARIPSKTPGVPVSVSSVTQYLACRCNSERIGREIKEILATLRKKGRRH